MRYVTSSTDLFDHMERLFNDLSRPVWQSTQERERSFNPACDIAEEETHYSVTVDLPGFKKEDIKIEMTDNVLSISGERRRVLEADKDAKKETERRYFERYHGSFRRSFSMPANVAADKVEAHYEDGVLSLYLPKVAVAGARKIEIQTKAGGFLERLKSGALASH